MIAKGSETLIVTAPDQVNVSLTTPVTKSVGIMEVAFATNAAVVEVTATVVPVAVLDVVVAVGDGVVVLGAFDVVAPIDVVVLDSAEVDVVNAFD
mmetsp:Transcript_75244/g.198241  ORF Transcript_75244/g.198241 Transcript_75244/m.198241 type:complete len:95 (-) Transcript_75244:24-308(-)